MVMHNLPYHAAPFVNRVSEIAEITHRLNDPDCHLLTLVGPGGIGKTRLAIQVAANCAEQFDDGVYFVPLQPLDSPQFIVSTIADIVSFQFSLGGDLTQQLLQYFREKALLLVLDNFEHLLDGIELLTEMLEAAPNIKLMVTSREVLKLQEEWLYPVRGLRYPKLIHYNRLGKGRHFAVWEQPDLFVSELRTAFKSLRYWGLMVDRESERLDLEEV
ncbi:MAG: AAA family ATPase, partial [Chloroflexota bacterium]